MAQYKTFISIGDFVDLYFKIKLKGMQVLWSKFKWSKSARTASKWNQITSSSDFWIIPEVRSRWNEKATGHSNLEYEDYVMSKYFASSSDLTMLSVGCGTGTRERKFASYRQFKRILGIDLAEKQIEEARKHASAASMDKIEYLSGEFTSLSFEESSFDLILFHLSLHHFDQIDNLLKNKILPLLKANGYLIIFEYVGPKRLQWTKDQLSCANELLSSLPVEYRTRLDGVSIKHKIYRPGIWRMMLVDPSEAVDSESIIPSIHRYFNVVEEKKIGWDISHLLFKDIAHHFLKRDAFTKDLLSDLLRKEDEFLKRTGRSDAIFGIYQKLKN
jgi:ubiquinone/menaquinone biosynthesis C-methylase UbiE